MPRRPEQAKSMEKPALAVLLAGLERAECELTATALAAAGLDPEVVRDGRELLAMVGAKPPAAIVIDDRIATVSCTAL